MRYAIVIEKAEGNYSAYVPDLPGCVATGTTVAEVEAEIRQAIVFHDPHIVALLARDHRLGVVGREVRDPVVGLDRPDVLLAPDRVARIEHEAARAVALERAVEGIGMVCLA